MPDTIALLGRDDLERLTAAELGEIAAFSARVLPFVYMLQSSTRVGELRAAVKHVGDDVALELLSLDILGQAGKCEHGAPAGIECGMCNAADAPASMLVCPECGPIPFARCGKCSAHVAGVDELSYESLLEQLDRFAIVAEDADDFYGAAELKSLAQRLRDRDELEEVIGKPVDAIIDTPSRATPRPNYDRLATAIESIRKSLETVVGASMFRKVLIHFTDVEALQAVDLGALRAHGSPATPKTSDTPPAKTFDDYVRRVESIADSCASHGDFVSEAALLEAVEIMKRGDAWTGDGRALDERTYKLDACVTLVERRAGELADDVKYGAVLRRIVGQFVSLYRFMTTKRPADDYTPPASTVDVAGFDVAFGFGTRAPDAPPGAPLTDITMTPAPIVDDMAAAVALVETFAQSTFGDPMTLYVRGKARDFVTAWRLKGRHDVASRQLAAALEQRPGTASNTATAIASKRAERFAGVSQMNADVENVRKGLEATPDVAFVEAVEVWLTMPTRRSDTPLVGLAFLHELARRFRLNW